MRLQEIETQLGNFLLQLVNKDEKIVLKGVLSVSGEEKDIVLAATRVKIDT